jgi:Domain of unknown function (DUF1996)
MSDSKSRLLLVGLASIVLSLVACSQTGKSVFQPDSNKPTSAITTPTPTTPTTPSTPNPTPVSEWVFCANAYSGCSFYGMRDVRIGANGKYVTKEFFGEVNSCRSEQFGVTDPNGDGGKTCEYSSNFKTATLAPAVNPMGPYVNLSNIPVGSPGYADVRIQAFNGSANEGPTKHSDATGGEFRTECAYSHMGFDDPIVFPGQPGKSHLHTFFGNTLTRAGSTADTIANLGNSTCAGGISNRTAYWVPTLIDTKDGTPKAPDGSIWYYKTGGMLAARVKPFPKGLRMIAGNAASAQASDSEHIQWSCWDTGGVNERSVPTTCPVGDSVVMRVAFPQCWDGQNLDSADHKSHMAYPISVPNQSYFECPSSHQVQLTQIGLNVKYKVTEAAAPARWRLSSDMYGTSKPGGFSAHGDWFNGWEEGVLNTWIKRCINDGYDCHGFLLGDGRIQF